MSLRWPFKVVFCQNTYCGHVICRNSFVFFCNSVDSISKYGSIVVEIRDAAIEGRSRL